MLHLSIQFALTLACFLFTYFSLIRLSEVQRSPGQLPGGTRPEQVFDGQTCLPGLGEQGRAGGRARGRGEAVGGKETRGPGKEGVHVRPPRHGARYLLCRETRVFLINSLNKCRRLLSAGHPGGPGTGPGTWDMDVSKEDGPSAFARPHSPEGVAERGEGS